MTHALVIGAGPAGLMAAEELAAHGLQVTVCEAKPSVGRKFLMAGKSGLNLAKDEPFEAMVPHYYEAVDRLRPVLQAFDAEAVQAWARGLGQDVFTGSTGRVFPRVMKASPLLRAWLARLNKAGVTLRTNLRWHGWQDGTPVFDGPNGQEAIAADVTVLALGGASWARLGSDGVWADHLAKEGVALSPFAPANVGLKMSWSKYMSPHFGAALKAVQWRAGGFSSRGEAVITERGLEGGGLYTLTPALRRGAPLTIDFMPDLTLDQMHARLAAKPAKTRLTRWMVNNLHLHAAKVALFHEMTRDQNLERADWAQTVKALPLRHAGLLPMDEAISTAGGVAFDALTPDLMLKVLPGVFCAGEMIDWEAPTGGYLITGCLATGRWAGRAAANYAAAVA